MSSNDLKGMFTRLARTLEDEANAGHDLFTWLPSYEVAKKHHGDYAVEVMPSTAQLLQDATTYIRILQYRLAKFEWPLENPKHGPVSAAEIEELMQCPCGEDHETGEGV